MSVIVSNKLVVAGWILFLICLILPATIENQGAVYGYQYGRLAVDMIFEDYDGWPFLAISGLGNVLAIFGVFVLISKSPSFLLFYMLLFLLFGLNNGWYYIGGMEELAVGYYVWVASYFLMGGGYLCSALKHRPAKSDRPNVLTRAAGRKR